MMLSFVVSEAVSPSSTWMRCGSARIGAACGSQVLPIQVVANKISAPYRTKQSTQVMVSMKRWEYLAAFLFRSLQCSRPRIQTKISTSISVHITGLGTVSKFPLDVAVLADKGTIQLTSSVTTA